MEKTVLITNAGATYKAVVVYDGEKARLKTDLPLDYNVHVVVYDVTKPGSPLLITSEDDWNYLFE